ncbi:MAG: ABC transporter ATP-binding protein [Blastocatellia bacterium]
MPDLVIETRELKKSYKDVVAVNGINLSVERGSIYGFLGRNGSGKTTTIKMLVGLAFPTSGEARVFGLRPDDRKEGMRIRERIGFVSEERGLFDHVKVGQMIEFTRAFYPKWDRALEERLLARFELPLKKAIKTLSKGMRAKLALLLALPRGAELLIFDEPTDGLDPEMAEETLQTIVSLAAANGATVFFSSHRLNEVEQIADHVCILDRGRVVIEGALDDLKMNYRRVHAVFGGAAFTRGMPAKLEGRVLSVLTNGRTDELVDRAYALNAVSVDVTPVTLKEIFLECREERTK